MRRRSTVQPSFADLELRLQGVELEPALEKIRRLLDRHGELVDLVYRDLRRGLKRPGRGRPGMMTAEQVLRAFILKSIKGWDLRELRERIADGLTLRIFTAFHAQPVPRHQALHACFARLTPATLRALNAVVVQAAVDLGLEEGKWLRVDTTVVETDIHFPTDSGLLWDSVRVLTRLMITLCADVPRASVEFANRSRRARRRMQEISRMTPHQRQRQLRRKYRDLLAVTAEVVSRGRRVAEIARKHPPVDLLAALRVDWCGKEISRFAALAERVINQAQRRVFGCEVVPAEEKLYSIFEPHTDLIKRGKKHKPVEFGHKVLLAESRIGLVTDYEILEGNPGDDIHVHPLLERHLHRFGRVPSVFAGDRGFFSTQGVERCQDLGVKHECLPQRGGRKTPERAAYEKSRAFRRGQRFRAGIEGRISVLFRGRAMKRCLLEGPERFEVFVGAAVLANNLLVLAEQLRRRDRPQRRAA